MTTILDEMADRYAKQIAKKEMRKISKIFYKSIKAAFKEGCIRHGLDQDFCRTECKLYNTEYRCKECKRNEFDGQIITNR